MKPYDPQAGEIWWFAAVKKHFLFLTRDEPESDYSSYKWKYSLLCLENGKPEVIMYGTMNAHGEGWFKRVA